VGGPIRHAVSNGALQPDVHAVITAVLAALEADGWETFSAHRAEAFGAASDGLCSSEVAKRDFDWMRRCDAFVAVLPPGPDGVLRTDGTHVELGWACALGKPIVALTPIPVPDSYGHLLRGLGAIARIDFVDIAEVKRSPEYLRAALRRATAG
jgi:nucleoside 2-deoxyribosyltransferase